MHIYPIDLGAIPVDIGVDSSSSQSVFVFSNSSKAVVLDHSDLSTLNSASIEDVNLEEVMNSVIVADGFSLLYNDSSNVVHELDVRTGYRKDNVRENKMQYLSPEAQQEQKRSRAEQRKAKTKADQIRAETKQTQSRAEQR